MTLTIEEARQPPSVRAPGIRPSMRRGDVAASGTVGPGEDGSPVVGRVLVLERAASEGADVARLLGRHAFDVETHNGPRALTDLAVWQEVDAAVVDGTTDTVNNVLNDLCLPAPVPVLILTRPALDELVHALLAGADDCLRLPYAEDELVARVTALILRSRSRNQVLRAADLEIDLRRHCVTRRGVRVPLTSTEQRLLSELVWARGAVLTRHQLLEAVWGSSYLGRSRMVDMAVQRLRDKLGQDSSGESLIRTVRGFGYRFSYDDCRQMPCHPRSW